MVSFVLTFLAFASAVPADGRSLRKTDNKWSVGTKVAIGAGAVTVVGVIIGGIVYSQSSKATTPLAITRAPAVITRAPAVITPTLGVKAPASTTPKPPASTTPKPPVKANCSKEKLEAQTWFLNIASIDDTSDNCSNGTSCKVKCKDDTSIVQTLTCNPTNGDIPDLLTDCWWATPVKGPCSAPETSSRPSNTSGTYPPTLIGLDTETITCATGYSGVVFLSCTPGVNTYRATSTCTANCSKEKLEDKTWFLNASIDASDTSDDCINGKSCKVKCKHDTSIVQTLTCDPTNGDIPDLSTDCSLATTTLLAITPVEACTQHADCGSDVCIESSGTGTGRCIERPACASLKEKDCRTIEFSVPKGEVAICDWDVFQETATCREA